MIITATNDSGPATSGADIDAVECLNNLAFGPVHIEKRLVSSEPAGYGMIDIGSGDS